MRPLAQFGKLAEGSTNLVLPANVSDIGAMVSLAMSVFRQGLPEAPSPPPVRR